MSKSAGLRFDDLRAICVLVQECRELGDSAAVWRRHFYRGLGRLTAAGVSVGGEFANCLTLRPTIVRVTDWGWENGFHRRGWELALREYRQDPAFTPLLAAYYARLRREDGVALTRTDVMADQSWYRCRYYGEIHSAIGVDHTLHCYRAIDKGRHTSVTLARPPGDRDYTARHRAIVAEAQRLVAPLVGGPLAGFDEPSPAALPPRVRDVLRCVLDGDSDKQVAARLKISSYTVNQYTKAIYRHFGVNSRAELLARWVRRGWGRGAW